MIISIIVSIANNGCIGGNNKLLWKQSDDLKRFKALTEGHVVIMGQKTYESLPFKPLKNRTNIVISNDPDVNFDGCVMSYSIDEAVEKAVHLVEEYEEVFIIGGGSIYQQFIDIAHKLYITRIDADIEGDTYFPEIDEKQWFKYFSEYHPKDEMNQYNYTFEIYRYGRN
jgi:dihydrofolate reductase